MADPSLSSPDGKRGGNAAAQTPTATAAFSPHNHTSSLQQRSTILLHQKSPLLLATPPQVTRALAYSHGFLIPLNKMVGLLSWTTGDPWESFLLVAVFWLSVLYGELVILYAGPVILVLFLVLGMYLRRFSPLSSTGWTGEKLKKANNSGVEHRISLDEILATIQAFTGRCNILLAPMIQMTDFLSTQQTATSATTRPALTALFVRILFATPVWFILTLPPLRIITGKRIVLIAGTLMLTWHSRPARIFRTILWRSRGVRYLASTLTGLNLASAPQSRNALPPSNMAALRELKAGNQSIRFTFSLYENQRRWIGLGWTSNMVAYERAPWTDEYLNATPSVHKFQLPEIEGGRAKWRWVEGSSWKVELPSSVPKDRNAAAGNKRDDEAWTYFDNKWLHGARGQDGWSKYTRRRKWTRDAELVDVTTETPIGADTVIEKDASNRGNKDSNSGIAKAAKSAGTSSAVETSRDDGSIAGSDMSTRNRKGWFGRARGDTDASSTPDTPIARPRASSSPSNPDPPTKKPVLASSVESAGNWSGYTHSRTGSSVMSTVSERERKRDEGMDVVVPTEHLKRREAEWGIGDDVNMELG